MGCPIRISQDHSLVAGSPVLFVGSNVLHRLLMPRHPSCALVRSRQPDVENSLISRLASFNLVHFAASWFFVVPAYVRDESVFYDCLATTAFYRQLSHFYALHLSYFAICYCSFLLATPCQHVTLGSVLIAEPAVSSNPCYSQWSPFAPIPGGDMSSVFGFQRSGLVHPIAGAHSASFPTRFQPCGRNEWEKILGFDPSGSSSLTPQFSSLLYTQSLNPF